MAGLERFQIARSLSASTRSALLVGVGVRVANTNNASAPGRPLCARIPIRCRPATRRQFRRFEFTILSRLRSPATSDCLGARVGIAIDGSERAA